MFAEGASLDWSAVYLRDVLGTSAGPRGGVHHGFALTMAVARLAGDAVVDRFGAGADRTGERCAGRRSAGCWWSSRRSRRVAMGGFALIGLGIAVVVPLAFAAAGRSGPAPQPGHRGRRDDHVHLRADRPGGDRRYRRRDQLVVSFGLVTALACGLVVGAGVLRRAAAAAPDTAAEPGRADRAPDTTAS